MDTTPAIRKGDWMQTRSGRAFYPLDPRIEDIDILDIAWALSMQCRYAGHTRIFYSVAEHCIHVSKAVPEKDALWGLLHDASEAYLVDLPRPIKRMMPDYQAAEDFLQGVIAARFYLPWPMPSAVKDVDHRILLNEQESLMVLPPMSWNINGVPVPGVAIRGWDPLTAYYEFMQRFNELTQRADPV